MRVQCSYQSGTPYPRKTLTTGNTPRVKFDVNFGEEFIVYGIMIWDDVVHYLLMSKSPEWPSWYPASLFKVVDHRIPRSWKFEYLGRSEHPAIDAIFGYEELLATDLKHLSDLAERERSAFAVFAKRRSEIESDDMG